MFTHALDKERFLSSLSEVYFVYFRRHNAYLIKQFIHAYTCTKESEMQCLHNYDKSNVTCTIGNGIHRLNVIKNGS